MTAPLKQQYDKEIAKKLAEVLARKNPESLPKLLKVSVNAGVGKIMTQGNKDYSYIEKAITDITGQQPNVRKARLSVSNFKLREGTVVGISTTLRGRKMYDFIERLVNTALPRVRDFRGISVKGFDGKGNYCLGLKDYSIFPALEGESLSKSHGLQINVCTSAENDYEAYLLLKAFGFPFKDEVKAPNS